MKKIILGAIVLALAALPAYAQSGSCCGSSSCQMSNVNTISDRSYGVQLPTLYGDTYDLSRVVGQAPVVIACLGTGSVMDSTARTLAAAAAEHSDVVFVAALCDTSAKAQKHARNLKLTLPVVLDPGGKKLGVCRSGTGKCVPTALFINTAGQVVLDTTLVTDEVFSQGVALLSSGDQVTDPVCGMTVSKTPAGATYDYKGTTYYFCSQNCLKLFKQNPGKYVKS